MTASAAVKGIREVDGRASIGVISSETHPPYDRPPLSKKLWKSQPLDSIWRKPANPAATLHLQRTVTRLDPANKNVVDDTGSTFGYDKLLLATGGTPRRLPFADGGIIYFRYLDDYVRLRKLTETGREFAVIGGGFIGSEIAAALAMNGKEVTLIFPDGAIGSRMFPADLAGFLNDFYRQKGVHVLAGQQVVGVESRGRRQNLKICDVQTGRERELDADGVVAGIGIEPNVDLAQRAGLDVENGVRVDSSLRTNLPDIFAAGDVALFYNPALDKWLRVEHEDNANTMGQMAGQSMAGRAVAYDHLPAFYSDLFELGYEAVGDVDSRLTTLADWKEPYRQGVIYYLKQDRVRGVLLWNVWGQVDAARRLISQPDPVRPESLRGRLPAAQADH